VTEVVPLIVLCSPDLMLAVRVEGVAVALGCRLRTAESAAAAAGIVAEAAPVAAVIDLAAPGLALAETVAALRRLDAALFVLGFFPHVQRELGAAGRAAGCSLVVPRSRFMAELPQLLRQAVEAGGTAARSTEK